VLAKEKYSLRGRELSPQHARFVPFTAQTRMSGVDLYAPRPALVGAGSAAVGGDDGDVREIRKGAADTIEAWVRSKGGAAPEQLSAIVQRIARAGARRLSWPMAATCSA
jgi:K+-transporting ATPase ATPase B chain